MTKQDFKEMTLSDWWWVAKLFLVGMPFYIGIFIDSWVRWLAVPLSIALLVGFFPTERVKRIFGG